MALIDIAMAFGCTTSELAEKFTPAELKVYVVRQMMKNGYTYIKKDIAEIEKRERKQRHLNFLQEARNHWNGKG